MAGALAPRPAPGSPRHWRVSSLSWIWDCSTRSRMPLTNRLDWAVLYRLASSSASLIATLAGISGRNSISYAPSRRILRSIAAIRSSRQFSATWEIMVSMRV